MKASDFFYKAGRVETTTPWFPPDPAFLNAWRDEFFQTPGVSNYTFWLCGAAMEPWPTTDVDVLVTGDITSFQALEDMLATAMELGFKHRQFIDIGWNDYYKKYLMKGPCERRSICCDHFYKHGSCTIDQCTAIVPHVETIVIGNEIIKNGAVITPADPHAIQLHDSLWKITFPSPSAKQIQRLRDGVVYISKPVIITPELDFKAYVAWP